MKVGQSTLIFMHEVTMNEQEREKIELIRQKMPSVNQQLYMNTGSVGPLAQVTHERLLEAESAEYLQGRGWVAGFMAFKLGALVELRERFGRLLGVSAETIALTRNTTEGINIAAHGLQWQAGDEIITTNWEHPGGYLPLYVLRERYGVTLRFIDLDFEDSAETIVERFRAAITPRTRLLAFSHVAWNSGLILPLTQLTELAHQHYAYILVDGAQSAGAIPLDLTESGVDFYAIPGQKWLCGLEGTGALYVRPDRLSLLSSLFIGYMSSEQFDQTGHYLPVSHAKRFEVGFQYRPVVSAMNANLQWLEEEVGWEWIYDRIGRLTTYAYDQLSALPFIRLISAEGTAGLITFNVIGHDPAQLTEELQKRQIMVRWLPKPYALRISLGFYNTEQEIDQLIAVLHEISG